MAPERTPLAREEPRLDALAALMEKMQAHHRVPCPSRAEIVAGLRARPAGAEILVVSEGTAVLGFAAWSAAYPGPGLRPGAFLKELYVAKAARGHGLGRRLMAARAAEARARGLARIDWTADPETPALLAFYDRLGAARRPEKLFYRLDGAMLEQLAE